MSNNAIDTDKFASVLYSILSDMSAAELVDRCPAIYDVVADHLSGAVHDRIEASDDDEISGVFVLPNFKVQSTFGPK